MKIKLFLLLIAITAFGFLNSTNAQITASSVTWALTSSSPQGYSATGLLQGRNMALSGLIINGYTGPNSSQRIKVNPNWPSYQKTEIAGVYIQFAVTVPANYMFHADSIALSIGANSTQSMKANIYYSTDSTFATSTQISYVTGITVLASGAPAGDSSHNVLSNTKLIRVKASSIGLTITAGQKLFVRVCPWVDNTNSTSGKYVCLQNVVIGGGLEPLPVDAYVVWGYNPSPAFITSGPVLGQAVTYNSKLQYYNKILRTIINTTTTVMAGELYPVTNSWPADTLINDSMYFEYAVRPKTGGTLAVKNISMYLGCRFADKLRASVYYSKDTFKTRTLLIADTALNPDFIEPFSVTLGTPDSVHTGEMFYLRVYPHSLAVYGSGSWKMVDVDSVRISGVVSGATSDPPTVANVKTTYISTTFAVSGGIISSDGGAVVTARGVCWNTAANPTIANSLTSDGTGSGTFISRPTGLTPGTTYYIRAYATNVAGTSYGPDSTFTTLASIIVPTVTKTAASNILAIQAKAGGNATAWGGDTIKAKGVCWNTTGNPTIANSKTVNGSDLGSFTSILYPLVQKTKYYFCAYATNSAGTGYSVVDSFTTQVRANDTTIVVAQDGSGNYTTVQAAFNAVTTGYTGTWTIFVKPGTYYEKDTLVTGKVNVVLRSIYPDSTIITYDAFADSPKPGGGTMGTSGCQTVAIDADDFTAINITFRNTKKNIGAGNLQAVALRTNGDRQSFYRCKIMGYQDTYYAWGGSGVGRVFMKNCYLEGSVDYIFGRQVVVFDSCEMFTNRQGGAVCAPNTDASSFGFVFLHSRLSSLEAGEIGFDGNPMVGFYLGRPWQSLPQCVYIRCYEPATLYPAGWTFMSVNPLLFAEYKCFGPGSDYSSRSTAPTSASRQLTDAEALNYTIENIFRKESNAAFAYDWMPDTTVYKFQQITGLANISGAKYGDAPIVLKATSNLPLTISSSNPVAASVSHDTVFINSLGSTTIKAIQAGNWLYSAARDSEILLTVSKAILNVTADNKTKAYGDSNPALTFSYSGFVKGETDTVLTSPVTVSTDATITSGAGDYAIVPGGAAADNYSFNYVNGKLTITKVDLTITAEDTSRTYGDTNPIFTATYSGFVNGDSAQDLTSLPLFSTIAVDTTSVGNYAITPHDAVSGNYNFNYVDGTLSITKAQLQITADDKIKTYGATNPALTAGYVGFVAGDTPADLATPVSLATDAVDASIVGLYTITASGATSPNYNISFTNGVLTVNKAALTIAAKDTSRKVGEANPTFTLIFSGFVNGDDASDITVPTASCTANDQSPAGDYVITLTGGSADNYTITLVNGKLTVNPLTGIASTRLADISIFPNPANNYVTIKRNNSSLATLSIINCNGQIVILKQIASDKESIDISSLSKGLYVMRLQGLTFRIVIR